MMTDSIIQIIALAYADEGSIRQLCIAKNAGYCG